MREVEQVRRGRVSGIQKSQDVKLRTLRQEMFLLQQTLPFQNSDDLIYSQRSPLAPSENEEEDEER
jgi:hypothetical protein